MLSVSALSGAAGSPTSAPVIAQAAQRALDRFGPSSIIGSQKPPSVFVVYTARGTFSSAPHVEPLTNGVTPTVADYVRAAQTNPIVRPTSVNYSARNVPSQIAYNNQGQLVHKTVLFQNGTNYQYATGRQLLI
jgi:hypothetical protein